jgi:hypothetical protein
MKDKFKSMLRKVGAAALEPTLEKMLTDRLSMASRPEQIQLALKFRETVNAQGKGMSFEDVGFNVFSPTWEDGILLYIFSLIGFGNRKCVDIGAGQVYGSNVANLLVNHGFTGLLADGSSRNIEINRQFYSTHLETKLFMPKLLSTFITAENVNGLLRDNGFSGEIDLFSLDIDGIDYWIWKAMDAVSPRVVVVEYQDLLGPDRAWTVPYRPDFDAHSFPVNEKQYNYCGASLRAFANLAKEKGYRLVGCSRGGWNAFFIRDGLGESFLPEVTVESCFRYEWNNASMETRFPLVKDMEWVEV